MADEVKQLQPKDGIKKILMMRKLADAGKEEGKRLSLQTTHSLTTERKANETATKDGVINTYEAAKTSMDFELIGSDDPLYDMLKEASTTGDKLEIWEIDFNFKTTDGKYNAYYMQGSLSSWEESNDADDFSSIKGELTIDGVPQAGLVTLENEVVNGVQYAFRDTAVVAAPETKVASK